MDNKEKRLRKDSSKIGFFLFSMVIIILFINRFLIGRLCLNDQYDLIRKVTNIFTRLGIPTIIFSILLKIKGKSIKKIINLNFKKEKLWFYIFISFFVKILAGFIATAVDRILELFYIKSTMPNFDYGSTSLSIFLSFIKITIVAAIAEEFVFRGAILNLLKPYGEKFAILASSLLFGLLHGNVDQFIFAFLMGLYFAYVACKTESIIPSVIMHFLNNALSSFFVIYKSNININNEIGLILALFTFIAGVLGFIFFISMLFKNSEKLKISNIFKRSKRCEDFKLSDKFNALIFNPGMIVFMFETAVMFYFSIDRVY